MCIYIVKFEPTRNNRFIFLNFSFFFAVSILAHLYNFVGTVFFRGELFARLYASQYLFFGLFYLLLALALVYLTIDVLFRDFSVLRKYFLALAIVFGFFGYYYYPVLSDPKYVYTTPEIKDWKVLDKSFAEYRNIHSVEPSAEILAGRVVLSAWRQGQEVGILDDQSKYERVSELYPYLFGSNYKILLYRPIYMSVVYMCVVCVGFILLFFGYQYAKDPPQGAYIEKIMFLFLIFTSIELLHAWSFAKSVEWETYSHIVAVGEYISLGVLLMIIIAFSARLRFITSPKGEFYEQELATNAASVTRWRDAIDDLVLASFFNRKAVIGRMYVERSREV